MILARRPLVCLAVLVLFVALALLFLLSQEYHVDHESLFSKRNMLVIYVNCIFQMFLTLRKHFS